MLTLLISLTSGVILSSLVYYFSEIIALSALIFVLAVIGINFLVGRYFMKKLNALMSSVEKDIKAERTEQAIEKLKTGYPISKWQFFVKKQIDSQIGSILYVRKKFDAAMPYLKNSFARNWPAMCMLAASYYREKDYANAYKTMESVVSSNKKEPFVYSLYAYFLSEQGNVDKAIQILTAGHKKIPLNERLESELESLKNGKKVKIQNYGAMWMQLHLGKVQEGAKSYQVHLMNQRFKRR